jgi:hypothetical protein
MRFFAKILPDGARRHACTRPIRLARVNDARMRRRFLHRSGTAAPIFTNSKPRRGLPPCGESPLSGKLHFIADKGTVMGKLFDNGGGRAMRALQSRC